ncbi:MAG: type II toxin-antitoxin system HigB family toxin [Pedobacter sp.]|nr:type II toxin-antitoxin system HigB family toxin [Chitinophagaceae bacterium]
MSSYGLLQNYISLIAITQLLIWYNEFSKMDFYNFNDLKKVYGNATAVNNDRVVFNIKGNYFRLVFL